MTQISVRAYLFQGKSTCINEIGLRQYTSETLKGDLAWSAVCEVAVVCCEGYVPDGVSMLQDGSDLFVSCRVRVQNEIDEFAEGDEKFPVAC